VILVEAEIFSLRGGRGDEAMGLSERALHCIRLEHEEDSKNVVFGGVEGEKIQLNDKIGITRQIWIYDTMCTKKEIVCRR
jgi:hypothetical protein